MEFHINSRLQSPVVGVNIRRWLVVTSVVVALSFATFISANSQTTSPEPAQPQTSDVLTTKRRAEQIERQRFLQLMAAAGLKVDISKLVPSSPNYLSITVRWISSAGNSRTLEEHLQTQPTASIQETLSLSGALPRQRSLELASDQLLVVTVNAGAQLRWWTTIPDPRILRSEGPGLDNQLSGETIQLKEVDFVVNIPEDDLATELRFYHPRWTGTDFVPVLVNTLVLVKK